MALMFAFYLSKEGSERVGEPLEEAVNQIRFFAPQLVPLTDPRHIPATLWFRFWTSLRS